MTVHSSVDELLRAALGDAGPASTTKLARFGVLPDRPDGVALTEVEWLVLAALGQISPTADD